MKTKERIFYYDFLRALAILFVVLCHTSPIYNLGNNSPIISHILYDLAKLGVPIFFMISGALLINKDYELVTFLKRRFTRILYPFLFWIVIILAGVYYINGTTFLLDMFFGINGQFTWFVWVLMGMYLFIPVFNPFMEKFGLKGAEYYLIFWLFTLILTEFDSYPLGRFDLSLFAGYFGVLVLGYWLDNKDFKISNPKLCIIGLFVFIVGLAINVYLNYINSILGFSIESCGYLDLITLIPASGLFIFVKYLNKLDSIMDKSLGKAITSISICSYGMYFTHIIAIRPFLLFFNHHNLLEAGGIFIIVVFVSWLVVYIFSKTPYLKKVSGV